MQFLSRITRRIGNAAAYLLLVTASGIGGAQFGALLGLAVGGLMGETEWWVVQGRCAGWTLFVLVAVVGAPIGFVYFYPRSLRQEGSKRTPPHVERERTASIAGQRTVGGIRALLIAPLAGAFMGLIGGGMLGGYLIAIYFLVALSPFGPGGWWPILPLDFYSAGDGFGTKNPIILIPYLYIVGTSILLGVLFGLSGITVGGTYYQVFRSNKV